MPFGLAFLTKERSRNWSKNSRKSLQDYLKLNGDVNMNTENGSYKRLAERLDNLPNGFPSTEDGAELRVLAYLVTPEEADLAAELPMTLETADQIAQRLGLEHTPTRQMLKSMVKRGLIKAGKADEGLGYGLLPFVVGIYENQIGSFDEEFARLLEDDYQRSVARGLNVEPA